MTEETYFDKLQNCPNCRTLPKVLMGVDGAGGKIKIHCTMVTCPTAIDHAGANFYATMDEAIAAWNSLALRMWLRYPIDKAMVACGLKRWKDGKDPRAAAV